MGPFLGGLGLWCLLYFLRLPRLQSCILAQTRCLCKSGRGVITLILGCLCWEKKAQVQGVGGGVLGGEEDGGGGSRRL